MFGLVSVRSRPGAVLKKNRLVGSKSSVILNVRLSLYRLHGDGLMVGKNRLTW